MYNLNSPTIKLIDFGSACFENQTVYSYIQSRHYRCPEVLIGSSYSAAIGIIIHNYSLLYLLLFLRFHFLPFFDFLVTGVDMWSLGCIAAELYLGLPLFPGTSEFNQLCRIVEMQGQPCDEMLDKAKQTNKFFNKNHNPTPGNTSLLLSSFNLTNTDFQAKVHIP